MRIERIENNDIFASQAIVDLWNTNAKEVFNRTKQEMGDFFTTEAAIEAMNYDATLFAQSLASLGYVVKVKDLIITALGSE